MNKYIDEYKGKPNPLIVARLNGNRLSDEEFDAAIEVLKMRKFDVSRWTKSTEDEDEEYEKLLSRANEAVEKILNDNDDDKINRLAILVGDSQLEDLPENDLEEILFIADMDAPVPIQVKSKKKIPSNLPSSIKPKKVKTEKPAKTKEEMIESVRKKRGRPAGGTNKDDYSSFRKARHIIKLLEEGKTATEIAMKGVASFSHTQRIKLRWQNEQKGILIKEYLKPNVYHRNRKIRLKKLEENG